MAKIAELTDEKAAEFGHTFIRWLTNEDPASVARFFPNLDPHAVNDRDASDLGRAVLEDIVAERFVE
ncbi:MAG: hypothetical protein WB793_02620 [Candidatus Dormiibacterota bacterium]|jgi:hypothetical protein